MNIAAFLVFLHWTLYTFTFYTNYADRNIVQVFWFFLARLMKINLKFQISAPCTISQEPLTCVQFKLPIYYIRMQSTVTHQLKVYDMNQCEKKDEQEDLPTIKSTCEHLPVSSFADV